MSLDKEYDKAKAKFYANPVFASLVGAAVGLAVGIILF